ncbi:MAG: phosphate propanoyltransferase [Clostridia bacterium]|nr:phosphate propanoyltransferase [Clostridia bacterium]
MDKTFIVEMSARHLHVTKEDLETLFGKGHELTPKKDLSQPGQFACEERVDLVGPKKTIPGVSILGPCRPETQVEVSLTDARTLGVAAAIRESGDIEGTAGIILRGPAGEVTLEKGVIAAKRHIHLTPEDAERLGVVDKEIVGVKIQSERSAILEDVVCRVSPSYAAAMHIDTDEANAVCLPRDAVGTIVK